VPQSFRYLSERISSLQLWLLICFTLAISVTSAWSFLSKDLLVSYGDAESHLNISKRVVDSITPGAAQLGGIWLPLPHLLMVPFVKFDFLWRTGLAGSIVSGASFIFASIFLFKLIQYLTKNSLAAFVGLLVFVLNPNVLYMQSTPMTELPLLAFFSASTYFFVKFLHQENDTSNLVLAAFFGFCATLSRYDGWFLVLAQAGLIVLKYLPRLFNSHQRKIAEGNVFLFSTVAFFGVFLWLLWDYLILGDPLYFTSSPFSAKSQQMGWQARGELPNYNNLPLSIIYYALTSAANIGYIMAAAAIIGLIFFLVDGKQHLRFLVAMLLAVPFVFYVVTLFMGQSVIFLPQLVPETFEWNLFNVRFGMMMIPAAAFFVGYLFHRWRWWPLRGFLIGLIVVQAWFFGSGTTNAITLQDGVTGLSASTPSDAEGWMRENYDGGLILMDDFARTLSVIRIEVPMQNTIYIGNKPYWEESLAEPEKYVTWIVMQENDSVWNALIEDPAQQGRLYAHFQKVYTSPKILIFKKTEISD